MKWFKCIDPNNPAMLEVENELGPVGCWQVLKVIAEALSQEAESIDVQAVANWARVKRDRAARLLPFVLKIYAETLKILGKSTENVQKCAGNLPKIYQKCDENLVDFDTSNQGGSIKDRENRTTEKKELSKATLPSGSKNGTRLPADWFPSIELIEWAKKERPDLNPSEVTDSFKDYWKGVAGAKGVKLDWDATFRNWVRNTKSKTFANAPPKGSQVSASSIVLAHERKGGSGKIV